jgi:phosphotriesterase-related protein
MNSRKGKALTVLGLVDPAQLGATLMHEHVILDSALPRQRNEPIEPITMENRWQMDYEWVTARSNRWLLDREVAAREMERLLQDGGQTVVEVSIYPFQLDPEGLRDVSQRTGVHIVRGVGRYTDEFMDTSDRARSVDSLAAEFIREIEVGFSDTEIRSGIIGEIGCTWPWTEAEKRSMRAAVIAQQQTGAALSIHPGRNTQAPFEIIDFVKKAGADISRTIMDHIERRLFKIEDILRLADTGCVIEFDVFGWETSRFQQGLEVKGGDLDLTSDGVRLTAIRALIDAGHLDRVVISQDIAVRTRLREFGGHGYGHIFRNIVPMMRRRGFTDREIHAILVANPARLLSFA